MKTRFLSMARLCGGSSRSFWPPAAGRLLALAALVLLPGMLRANGTAYYLDVNWPSLGLGAPSGVYNQTDPWWTTDATGATQPAALPASVQMTFGTAASDFNGSTFTVNLNNGNWSGLLVNSTNANITISGTANAYLSGAQTWTVAAASTFTDYVTWNAGALNFNNVALTLNGGGTINFQSALGYNSGGAITEADTGPGLTVNLLASSITTGTTYVGFPFTLASGNLNFAAPAATNALGTGAFTISGGTIDNTSGGPITLVGLSGITIANSFTFAGSTNLNLGNSAVTLTGNPVVTVNTNTLTLGGNINGAGSLIKSGPGTLVLNGVRAYSGFTTVNAGELISMTGNTASNGLVTVGTGATNGVQINGSGGQWVCAGLSHGAGTTYADLIFNQSPSPANALIQVNGNLALNGNLQVIIRGGANINPGTYPLIKYTGTLSGTPPTAVLSLPQFMAATIVNNTGNKSIDLNVTAGNNLLWAVGSGAWDIATSQNWKGADGTPNYYTDGVLVTFDDTASGPSPITVSVDTTVNPAGVTADLTNYSYTISGSGSISGGAVLTKNGPNTLTLNGANNYTGGTVLNGGTLALTTGNELGGSSAAVALTGGTLDLGGTSPAFGNIAMSGGTIQNGIISSLTGLTANPPAGSAALMNASFTTSSALNVNGAGGFYLNGDANGDPIALTGTINDLGTLNLTNANVTLTTSGTAAFFVGSSGATGIVNQAGGTVSLGQNYGSYSLLMGNGTAGTASFYNLSGGSLNTTAGLGLGINTGCSAKFTMTGGALNAAANLEIGRNYGPVTTTTNSFLLSGGTVTANNLYLAPNTNQVAYLSISNASFTVTNFKSLAAVTGAVAQIYLGPGGVLNAGAFPSPDPTVLAAGNVTFTNNGGTLSALVSSGNYMPVNTFSSFVVGNTNVGGGTINVPAGLTVAMGQGIGMLPDGSYKNQLVKTGQGELILNGFNTYNWITSVMQGALRINGSPSLYVNVASGATYGGVNPAGGLYSLTVSNGAALSPGSADNTAGTLIVRYGGNPTKLNFLSGAMLNLDLANNTNAANNDLIMVTGSATSAVNNANPLYVNFNFLNGPPPVNQPYTIITNSGTFGSGFVANLVVGTSRYTPTFTLSGKTIAATFTYIDPKVSQLVWQGDNNGNDQWIVGVTNEWINGNGAPSVFYPGDATTFNDTAMSYVVNLVGTLLPGSVTVKANNGYTLQGSGNLAGATSLIQGGPGTLTLNTTNTYTGGTILSNNVGPVVALVNPGQDALGAGPVSIGAGSMCQVMDTTTTSGATTTISNLFSGPGSLQLNFAAGTSARNTYVTGATNVTGTIELANSGTTADKWNVTPGNYLAMLQIDAGSQLFDTTAGTTAFSGISAVNTGNSENRGAIRMSSATAVLAGPIALQGDTTIGMEAAGATISGTITNATSSLVTLTDGTANSSGAGTFSGVLGDGIAGGTLALVKAGSGMLTLSNANTFSGSTTISAGAILLDNRYALSNSIVTSGIDNGLTFASGLGSFVVGGISGSTYLGVQDIFGGPLTLSVGNNNSPTTYDGSIGGLGNLVKIGQGTLTLSGAYGQVTNSGTLTVSNGVLVVNCGTGSNTVAVATNGTLSGTGPFNGPVVVQAGGTLAPGNNAGTLVAMAIMSNLVLNAGSFTTVVVDKGNSVFNQVTNLGSVSYGGTLIVSNLSGTLVNGDSFPIFSAAAYANNFTSIVGPPVPTGLQWNFAPATGMLSVGPIPPPPSTAPNPTNISYTISGNTLTLKWPADHLGWFAQSNAVNLAKTNAWFDVPGSTNATSLGVTITPAKTNVFYRLRHP